MILSYDNMEKFISVGSTLAGFCSDIHIKNGKIMQFVNPKQKFALVDCDMSSLFGDDIIQDICLGNCDKKFALMSPFSQSGVSTIITEDDDYLHVVTGTSSLAIRKLSVDNISTKYLDNIDISKSQTNLVFEKKMESSTVKGYKVIVKESGTSSAEIRFDKASGNIFLTVTSSDKAIKVKLWGEPFDVDMMKDLLEDGSLITKANWDTVCQMSSGSGITISIYRIPDTSEICFTTTTTVEGCPLSLHQRLGLRTVDTDEE